MRLKGVEVHPAVLVHGHLHQVPPAHPEDIVALFKVTL